MKTKLVYFVLFVALAFIVIGCGDGGSPAEAGNRGCGDCYTLAPVDNDDGELSAKAEITLEDTKWEFIGFFDVKTGQLRGPALEDCVECYILEFGHEDLSFQPPKKYYLSVYTTDEKLTPNPDNTGMSNDEELNLIFKEFGVIRYYQIYPGINPPELQNYYSIHMEGDLEGDAISLQNVLNSKNLFEEVYIEDYADYPGIPGGEVCYDHDAKIKIQGVEIGCYQVSYRFSWITITLSSYDNYDEYRQALQVARAFEQTDSELKLYDNIGKQNYLLFRSMDSGMSSVIWPERVVN